MSALTQRLRALAREADALAKLADGHGSDALAADVMSGLVPQATLHAARSLTGTWYAYLVMPRSWRPPTGARAWIYNETAGHYWRDFDGTTERDALLSALTKLVEVSR